jgi:hypothetical protein
MQRWTMRLVTSTTTIQQGDKYQVLLPTALFHLVVPRPSNTLFTNIQQLLSKLGTMSTMKEAHIDADTNVTLHDVPLPELMDPHEILIKVVVVGCNPKDWKMPAGMLVTIGSCPNSGDDVAGVYHPNSDPSQLNIPISLY